MNLTRPARTAILATTCATALATGLTACATTDDTVAIRVDNCGHTLTLDHAPTNATLLKPAAVPTLAALGVLDDIGHKAGQYPTDYYDQATNDALASIPSLTDKLDASGHLQIGAETVIADSPDLVIGNTDTINPATMAATGTPTVEEPALCGDLDHPADWSDIDDEVHLYGTLFDRPDRADQITADLDHRRDQLTAAADHGEHRTVAVLYPTAGGPTYAYGTGSMSNPLVETAGLTNVFDDTTDRVFEVTAEEIADRNPDVIISLYSAGTAAAATDQIRSLNSTKNTTAVTTGHIMPMLLNYADPPTPLALDGLEKLTDYLTANPADDNTPTTED
jgi:iron complex transport system substrate-binding protein